MSSEYTDALPTGLKLEGYEIVRVLGVGGFGVTYLGFDDKLNMAVAIKEYLPSDLARRDSSQTVTPRSTKDTADFQWGLDRFLSEAQDLARFDHPNIIRVRRFFEAHGTAYIVMDYAEGKTLAALIEHQGPLTEARVKDILLPLMDGLDEVHRSDLLHRDIKPGNIIIKENGQPVLIDFGAARQSTGARSRSMTAVLTPGYAPLEQYSTKGNQGAWTDIYALAAVAYRALTGITPEEATNRIKNDPLVPAVTAGKSQASSAFLKALDWALAVDEEERPQTIAAFRAALGGEVAIQLNRKPASGQKKQAKATASFWQGLPSFGLNKAAIIGLAIALIALPALGLGYVQYTTNDEVSWQKARRANTIAAYQDYITSFLLGSYQDQAMANIKNLEDKAAWQKAKSTNTITAYKDYIKAFSSGSYRGQAMTNIKNLEDKAAWQKAKSTNTITAYKDYIEAFPSGSYRDQAQADIKALQQQAEARRVGARRRAAARRAAEAREQFNLGKKYFEGLGVTKDYAKALEWFHKSANQGNVEALARLGGMYYHGFGVAKDYAKAVEWWRKSAKQGNVYAQFELGGMYYEGRGVAKNRSIACDWWRKAAAQNDFLGEVLLKKHCS